MLNLFSAGSDFYTLLWDGYSPPALYHSVRYTMLLFSHSPAFLCIAFWPGSFATDTVRFYIPGSFVLCGGIVRDSASWADHIVIVLIMQLRLTSKYAMARFIMKVRIIKEHAFGCIAIKIPERDR